MSYLSEYSEAMDYVREKFDLPPTVSLYEAVVKLVSDYKRIEEHLQKSRKEKPNVRGTKKSSGSRGNSTN